MSTPARRAARLALVGAGVLALLAVVVVASRGGFGHGAGSAPSSGYASWALSILLVLLVAATPFALWTFVAQQREVLAAGPRKSFGRRTLESLIAFAALCLIVYGAYRLHLGRGLLHHGRPAATRPAGRRPPSLAAGQRPHASQPQFEWPVLWAALAVAALAAALVARSRRRPLEPPGPTVQAELAAGISDALDDLEAEPDPRRAVVAAYARMEAILGRHGLARRASQTPLEYLRRVLAELSGRGEAAARLTALFEEARFSAHPVDGSMKRDAIDALRSIRDGLADPA